jgi:hypothetical protein
VFVLATTYYYNRPGVGPKAKRRKHTERTSTTKSNRGRPPVHQETWSKVSVVLFDRQIRHLDQLTTGTRGRSGKVFNRAEIIRALIDGFIDSSLDITSSTSEADLRARVARHLGSQFP